MSDTKRSISEGFSQLTQAFKTAANAALAFLNVSDLSKQYGDNPYFSMTDEVYCANMASFIINRHPNMPVTEGALAIFIGTYTDANYESMMAGRLSCNHFAFAILEEFPYITDDYIVLAGTIEDWREKVKTGDIDSE